MAAKTEPMPGRAEREKAVLMALLCVQPELLPQQIKEVLFCQ